MPTPSEQKALAFVSIVVLLGGAVRLVRAGGPLPPSDAEQQSLASQTAAAESAAGSNGRGKHAKTSKVSRSRRDAGTGSSDSVGAASHPIYGYAPRTGSVAYPPPTARIDVGASVPSEQSGRVPTRSRRATKGRDVGASPTRPVDLDVAGPGEIEGLPRIGPALAARILANRDSFGAFGSLEGLRRVRGIGPGTIRLLADLVTFSGRPASFNARNRY